MAGTSLCAGPHTVLTSLPPTAPTLAAALLCSWVCWSSFPRAPTGHPTFPDCFPLVLTPLDTKDCSLVHFAPGISSPTPGE